MQQQQPDYLGKAVFSEMAAHSAKQPKKDEEQPKFIDVSPEIVMEIQRSSCPLESCGYMKGGLFARLQSAVAKQQQLEVVQPNQQVSAGKVPITPLEAEEINKARERLERRRSEPERSQEQAKKDEQELEELTRQFAERLNTDDTQRDVHESRFHPGDLVPINQLVAAELARDEARGEHGRTLPQSQHELKHGGLAARAQSAVDKGVPLQIEGGDTTTGVPISEIEAAQVVRAIMRLEASLPRVADDMEKQTQQGEGEQEQEQGQGQGQEQQQETRTQGEPVEPIATDKHQDKAQDKEKKVKDQDKEKERVGEKEQAEGEKPDAQTTPTTETGQLAGRESSSHEYTHATVKTDKDVPEVPTRLQHHPDAAPTGQHKQKYKPAHAVLEKIGTDLAVDERGIIFYKPKGKKAAAQQQWHGPVGADHPKFVFRFARW